MHRRNLIATFVLFSAAAGGNADADDLKVKSQGELGLETRVFLPTGNTDGDDYNVAMAGRLIVDGKLRPFKMRLRGFVRHDAVDRERSALFPEEAWLEFKKSFFRLRAGYQMLTWTATEAFHPADIVNSRYLDGNIQSPEKLGEPMASMRFKFGDGNVEAMFMPSFIEPIFPSASSRYRFAPPGVELGETFVLDSTGALSDERWFPQGAVRAQYVIGSADVSAHAVHHIDRSLPLVVFDPVVMEPHLIYQAVTQVGGTYQQVFGPIVVKLEGAYRMYRQADGDMTRFGPVPDRDHGMVASGMEYGFGHDSGGESTILFEAQSVIGLDDNLAALMPFQRDALIGYRFADNGENDQSVTASLIVDLESPDQVFGAIAYSRRIGETWRTQVGVRLVHYPPDDPDNPVGAEWLNNINYGYANLTRFF